MAAMAGVFDFADRNVFSNFGSASCPDNSFHVLILWLLVQETKFKTDFQDGRQGGHLGFPIGTSTATFDLQVTMTLPTKFRVSWPFG